MEEELDAVRFAHDEDTGVGTITLNRPDNLNAISPQLADDVEAALMEFRAVNDEADGVDVTAVLLEGAGESFCSGADLMSFANQERPFIPRERFWGTLRSYELPIVTKIHGYCLGGGLETALACDLRLAHEDATFGFPEIELGLLPGAGGVHYVARVAGEAAAKELAFTGEKIGADRAQELGIVNRVYADGEFEDAVAEYVEDIAANAPLGLQALKSSVNRSLAVPLDEAREFDMRLFMELLETDDFNQGIAHFGQDTSPDFEGK